MYKNFNLTDEERKQIMEMHKSYGYRKPMNEQEENYDVSEEEVDEATAPEPVKDNETKIIGILGFQEGKTKPSRYNGQNVTQKDIDMMVNNLVEFLTKTGTIETLRKFRNSPDFRIPQFIEIHIGTSHTGSGEQNASVAQGRFNFMTGIVMAAFRKIGVDASVAKSVVVNKTDSEYSPSKLDRNFYDPKLVKPDANERLGWFVVTALETQGLGTKGIQDVQRGLNQSSSIINNIFVDGVDETKIIRYLQRLQTFSDVEDLNDAISAGGKFESLEDFLNDQLFDDSSQMRAVAVLLQNCAMKSGKQKNTVRTYRDSLGQTRISIGLGE